MRIVARYITKEVVVAFSVITLILLLIVLSNRFAAYLAKAATGELPIKLVFHIVGLYTPELLSYLIPLGLFIAILFTYGRLYADSEMIVLFACGVSLRRIINLTIALALVIALLTGWLTLWCVPKVALLREKILAEGEAFGVMQSLLPGRFQSFAEGRLVFYIEDVSSKQDNIKGVFIAERPTDLSINESSWAFITAEDAKIKRDEKTHDFYLVLNKGHRYQGLPGTANYTLVSFEEYGRTIPHAAPPIPSDSLRLKESVNLFTSRDPVETAELQWRLSLPLTVPILALLAVPFSRVRPRQGRFAKFLPAIGVYIIYYNLFTVSKRWVASGVLPAFIGVWWVHLLFLLIGLSLVVKESSGLRK